MINSAVGRLDHNHHSNKATFDYRQVPWKDLVEYHRFETTRELLLPLPWLAAAFFCGAQGWLVAMGICVIYVFMLGLRVAHNAFHGTLGLSQKGDDWVMFIVSLFMLGSSHAINFTHRYHHNHCMQKGDVEGELASLPFWRALLKSPGYPFYIHVTALKNAPAAQKYWIVAEIIASLALQITLLVVLESSIATSYTLMMLVANALAPMVGIWAVHHHCEDSPTNARSCRITIINALSCGMFFHAEHHLFPAVPTRHLQTLAQRIDDAGAPEFYSVMSVVNLDWHHVHGDHCYE